MHKVKRTRWTTKDGKIRRIRLYRIWIAMNQRVKGIVRGNHKGLSQEFSSWEEFREWALSNGYRKGVELDRIDNLRGYSPDNCQFLTKSEHWAKINREVRLA